MTDVFTLQNAITAKAATAIAPQTQYAEMSSAFRKEITDLSDWERLMRARWHMDKFSRANTDTALVILCDDAEAAGNLALAHSTMAVCNYQKRLKRLVRRSAGQVPAGGGGRAAGGGARCP